MIEQNSQELLEKIINYRKSPEIFCKEQCKIKHPIKGLINFNIFPAQTNCIYEFLKHRFNIILKSRQIGISTVVAGYAFWKLIFFPHQEIRVVATKNETAQVIIKMVYTMLQNCDKRILSILNSNPISDLKHTIELSNGSRMQSFGQGKGENPDTGVGQALSLLIIDEAALIRNMDDIWTSIYPTLSQGGDCIALSTPRGNNKKNWFYNQYSRAESKDYMEGEIPFNPIKLMWWENLDRISPPETPLELDSNVVGGKSNSWSRATFANIDTKKIAQEYCTSGFTKVTIRDPKTNDIKTISIYELKDILNENL